MEDEDEGLLLFPWLLLPLSLLSLSLPSSLFNRFLRLKEGDLSCSPWIGDWTVPIESDRYLVGLWFELLSREEIEGFLSLSLSLSDC